MKETDFAQYLTQFLSVYLPGQVGSKRNTQLAYRDSFSLFLRYCRDQENLSPEKLTVAKVDRELILRFLQWLEDERNCKAATRNQRLAAIHSFFSFLMVEEPQYMQQSQKILAIPMKKTDKPPLMYLPLDSIKGLLEQPDRTTTQGKRDAVWINDRIKKNYGRDTSLIYYDVTNYYFETDEQNDFLRKGVSKEHRPDPIVQMGLFMDNQSIPITYELFPGNTNDCLTYRPNFGRIKKQFDLGRVISIADKGMTTGDNI